MKHATTHRYHAPHRQRGFSLMELMVAMTLGMILIAGTMTMFGTTIRGNTELLSSARLNGELGGVAAIMANELRRAGYTNGLTGMYPTGYDLALPAAGCALYSYDLNRNKLGAPNEDDNANGTLDADEDLNDNSTLDTGDDGEWFGFRRGDPADSTDKSIWMRTTCTAADATCASSCSTGTWQRVTDQNTIVITGLTLTTTGSKCINVSQNEYWVTTATNATTFPCPTAAGGTAPSGTTGYLYSSGAYTVGTPTAVASGDAIVEVRMLKAILTGCIKDSRDTNNNCVVDTGEDFTLYSGLHEIDIKVRNDSVRRIP